MNYTVFWKQENTWSPLCLELSSCLLIHSTSSYPPFRSLFYIFPRWTACFVFSPQGIYLARSGMGRALHLKGGVGLLDKHALCCARPKGPVGTWSWTWEAAWLPVSATLLAVSSSTFMIWINWAMPSAHVMVALGDSTCRGQIWIPAIYLQTTLPKSWKICLINKLRYARYEQLASHKWTWFLL